VTPNLKLSGDIRKAARPRGSPVEQRQAPFAAVLTPPPPVLINREGVLTKQGGIVKHWKQRYFVLSSDALRYYASKDDEKPLGVIEFADSDCAVSVVDDNEHGRAHVFALNYRRNKRIYYIQADSAAGERDTCYFSRLTVVC
jgi:hypothetical protein